MSTTALTALLAKLAGVSTLAKAGVGFVVVAGAAGAAVAAPAVIANTAQVGEQHVVVATNGVEAPDVTPGPTVDPSTALPGFQERAVVAMQIRAADGDGQQVAVATQARNQVRATDRVGTTDGTDATALPGDRTQDKDRLADQDRTQDKDRLADQDRTQDMDRLADQDKDQVRAHDGTCDEVCTPIGDGPHARG